MRLITPKHGRGKLSRSGRKKDTRSLITREFYEFAKMELSNPDVQARIRGRLAQELNRKSGPLPTLTILAAVSMREKPSPHGANVTFIARIVGGRGEVKQVELAKGETTALPALPAGEAEGSG